MPHVQITSGGSVSATADITATARQLIPGIEPGGSRAGGATKPALLIQKAYIVITDFILGVDDVCGWLFGLKLSQEPDLNPGLLLQVSEILFSEEQAAAGTGQGGPSFIPLNDWAGTIWAPAWVGLRMLEIGAGSACTAHMHLDFERIEVPWMDWFIMWEFLDNVTDNSQEF